MYSRHLSKLLGISLISCSLSVIATQSVQDQSIADQHSFAIVDLTSSDPSRISVSGENTPNEGKTAAFDNNNYSKWLTFSNTGWISYRLDNPASVVGYSVTSANDVQTRDPKTWQFQGSNDGLNWQNIDSQSNQTFSARYQKKNYSVSTSNTYSHFRFNITQNGGANITQVAELEFLGDSGGTPPPSVITLIDGQPVTNIGAQKGIYKKYKIVVPENATKISFETSGGSGDADLYIKLNSEASSSNFDCKSESSTSTESCAISNPTQGTYYASVYAWSTFNSVSLVAKITSSTTPGITELTNGQAITQLSDSKNNIKLFKLSVPANARSLAFSLTGGSGDADLFVKFNEEASNTNYDCRSINSNSNETCTISNIRAGDYYVAVLAYSNYSNVSIKGSFSTSGGDDWSQVASPTVDFRNDGSAGGQLFNQLVPDVVPYIHDIARGVVQSLYKSPSEVPAFSELELRIERWENDPNGVAWKAGNPPRITVNVNAYHLERVNNKGDNVAEEVKGVLYHEMTHAYQHFSGAELSAIEGLADAIRYLNGYIPLSNRRPGGHWTNSYQTTGFFLVYLHEEKGINNFVHCFNQQARPGNGGWSWNSAVQNCAGGSVQNLWNEYQAWLQNN